MAKKEEIKGIEIHSEEVQDILGPIPGRLINWGASIIFSIFIVLIAGSYFFSFNEIVSAPMIITTANPPAPLISNASGRIENWFVHDGEIVQKGNKIALISNSANLDDIILLGQFIDTLNLAEIKNVVVEKEFPVNLSLGDIQSAYTQLVKDWEDYSTYIQGQYFNQKIRLLKQEQLKQDKYYELLLEQQKLQVSELDLAEKRYGRFESLRAKGGISETELENAKTQLLQSKKSYLSFLGSLNSNEMTIISHEKSILELEEQNRINIEKYEWAINNNITVLKKMIDEWMVKYLVCSPISGRVTFTKYWSKNHVISSGERLATVVPASESQIICRANVPSTTIGKVEKGQKVNLKLSGYPFMQYGMLEGTVNTISLVPENNEYIVEIGLQKGMKSNYSEQLKLIQEMGGTAEIVTKRTRAINRFINPLKSIVKEGI